MFMLLVWNQEIARLSKEHDNANILVILADFVTNVDILVIVQAWLDAQFLKGRYQERLIPDRIARVTFLYMDRSDYAFSKIKPLN